MKKIVIMILFLLIIIQGVFASGLRFSDIDVDVNGDSQDNVDKDGGSFEAAPGDRVEITIEAENTFDVDTDGHEIRSLDVQIEIGPFCPDDLDDEIDESLSLDNLDPGSDDAVTFRFYIPICAEEDNYDLDITVEGKDHDDNTKYRIIEKLLVQLEKHPSEVYLDFGAFEPDTVTCEERTVKTTVEVHNIGALDEDAGLLLINNDISINRFNFLDLRSGDYDDEDTYHVGVYTFTVDDSVPAGDYQIRAEVEYDNNRREVKRYRTITVKDCEEETVIDAIEDITEENNEDVEEIAIGVKDIVKDSDEIIINKENIEDVVKATQTSYTVPMLVGAIIIAIFILVLMIIMLKRNSSRRN